MQSEGELADRTVIDESALKDVLQGHVTEFLGLREPATVDAILEQLRQRHGILGFLGETTYAFCHRSFLEYFLAKAIAKRYEADALPDTIVRHAQDASWHEALCLVGGMLKPSSLARLLPDVGAVDPVLALLCVEQAQSRTDEVMVAVAKLRHSAEMAFFGLESADSPRMGVLSFVELFLHLWPDDRTRSLYVSLVQPKFAHVVLPLYILKCHWPDDVTRRLVVSVVRARQKGVWKALDFLVELGTDDDVFAILMEVINSDTPEAFLAVELLAKHWPEERALPSLADVVLRSTGSGARRAAYFLAEQWPDHRETWAALEAAAQKEGNVALAALGKLADVRPDDTTLAMLLAGIKAGGRRSTVAISRLRGQPQWRNENTRAALTSVVMERDDDDAFKATELLASQWPDDVTRADLEAAAERAVLVNPRYSRHVRALLHGLEQLHTEADDAVVDSTAQPPLSSRCGVFRCFSCCVAEP